jgi:hypothetical protein
MEAAAQAAAAAQALGYCAALLAGGYALRASGVLRAGDASTLLRVAASVTLPALLLHTLPVALELALEAPLLAALPAIGATHVICLLARERACHAHTQALDAIRLRADAAPPTAPRAQAFGALALRRQRPSDRALAVGCSLGGDVPTVVFPLAEALLGIEGLRAAALLHAPAAAAAVLAAPACFALGRAAEEGAGSARHADGGVYHGQWLNGVKDGSGVYAYASGARYEGEWRANAKHGRGVYTFPRGGAHAGEWRAGQRAGLGVRTYAAADKPPTPGRWEADALSEALPARDVETAAQGALDAAAAARDAGAARRRACAARVLCAARVSCTPFADSLTRFRCPRPAQPLTRCRLGWAAHCASRLCPPRRWRSSCASRSPLRARRHRTWCLRSLRRSRQRTAR